jgi:GNAT superfamily N-acetyltransferase
MGNDLREKTPSTGSGAPELWVRRLSEQDQPLLEAFLATFPGYSLFLSANLVYLRANMDLVRYWGGYVEDRLAAVLMMVGRRAMISAEPRRDLSPLARVAALEQVDFMMGQPEGVDALLGELSPGAGLERREEHLLAELAVPAGEARAMVVPPGVMIRRAYPSDLEALTTLYYGADGFESVGKDQVRRTMYGRIRSLRTWVAESQGQLQSAASTSAETAQAAMIGGVWTAPTARNRGLSTAVTAALARELVTEGRRPYLFYLTDNAAAAHVYSQVGFSTIGRWSVIYLTPRRPGE